MKKQMLLSILIVSSTSVFGMESYISFSSYCSSLFSYFSASFSDNKTVNESKLVSALRQDIRIFENQLKLDKWREREKTYLIPETLQLFSHSSIRNNPVKFLQYCYYQKFHKNEHFFSLDIDDINLFDTCRNAQIGGYSALSAAILATDVWPESKLIFMQELINHDFKPTEKDIKVTNLYFYDMLTVNQKEMFMHLLHALPTTHWHELPQDIRQYIAHYVIQLLKENQGKTVWFLPVKKKTNDCMQVSECTFYDNNDKYLEFCK